MNEMICNTKHLLILRIVDASDNREIISPQRFPLNFCGPFPNYLKLELAVTVECNTVDQYPSGSARTHLHDNFVYSAFIVRTGCLSR